MNAVRFNEPFVSRFGTRNLEIPLFDYHKEKLITDVADLSDIFDWEQTKVRLPFDRLRACVALPHESVHGVLIQEQVDGEWVVSFTFTVPQCKKEFAGRLIRCEFWFAQRDCLSAANKRVVVLTEYGEFDPGQDDPTTKKIAAQALQVIVTLANDYLNPHLYLCQRTPRLPQGHSIVWQKAREHYVFVHKSHTANRAEHVGNKLVMDGPLIDRIAHSRRAHFRMLRSSKFVHKQGQRIWIQSAWIGPKEWIDRSGQIYRIVERPQMNS